MSGVRCLVVWCLVVWFVLKNSGALRVSRGAHVARSGLKGVKGLPAGRAARGLEHAVGAVGLRALHHYGGRIPFVNVSPYAVVEGETAGGGEFRDVRKRNGKGRRGFGRERGRGEPV